MKFDLKGAREAGYSDAEIAGLLADRSSFDLTGALDAGYSHTEVIDLLTSTPGATDYAKSAAAGVLSGAGMIAQGGGELLARGVNAVAGTELRAENPFKGAIDWLNESQSYGARRAKAESQITGSLFDPSTWDFGTNPNLHGIALQGIDAIGQFAPNLAVALTTAGLSVPAQLAVGATVGGIQALGGAAGEERERVEGMTHEQLVSGSALYRTLIEKGIAKDQAKAAVADAAALGGGLGNAIPSAAEGAFENFLVGALTKGKLTIAGKGIVGKALTGAAGGAALGGTEEAVEQVGQNIGANLAIGGDRPVTADTLQQFVMGALAEGTAGAGAGALQGGFQSTAKVPVSGGAKEPEKRTEEAVREISAAPTVDQAIEAALAAAIDRQGAVYESDVTESVAGGIIGSAMGQAVDRAERATVEDPAYQQLEAQRTSARERDFDAMLTERRDIDAEAATAASLRAEREAEEAAARTSAPSKTSMQVAWEKTVLERMEALERAKGASASAATPVESEARAAGQAPEGPGTGTRPTETAAQKPEPAAAASSPVIEPDRGRTTPEVTAGLHAPKERLEPSKLGGKKEAYALALAEQMRANEGRAENGLRPLADDRLQADAGRQVVEWQEKANAAGRRLYLKTKPEGGWALDPAPTSEDGRKRGWRDVAAFDPEAGAIDTAAHEAAPSPQNALPEPTDAQKQAGNYKKGHTRISGLDISIENPEGSERSGTDQNGKKWSMTMRSHYGYVRGTVGYDKDHVDVFIKPSTPQDWSGMVYVVNQNKGSGQFDEHKVMLGYESEAAAREAYLANYEQGWEERIRSITPMPLAYFKAWAGNKTNAGPKGGEAKPILILGKRVEQHTRKSLELAARKAKTRAQREMAQAELDRRAREAKLDVPADTHELLRIMAKNSGHLEEGGRAVGARDAFEQQRLGVKSREEMQAEGRGRTQWIGQPEWAKGFDMNPTEIQAAVEKAIAGQTLGPRQRAIVELMLKEIAETRANLAKGLEEAGVPAAEQAEIATAVENEVPPDEWSTMSEGEKDAYLDNLFGAQEPAAQGEAGGARAPEEDVRPAEAERQPGQDDEEVDGQGRPPVPAATTALDERKAEGAASGNRQLRDEEGGERELWQDDEEVDADSSQRVRAGADRGRDDAARLGSREAAPERAPEPNAVRSPAQRSDGEGSRPALELSQQTEQDLRAKEEQAATGQVEERAAVVRDRDTAVLSAPEGTAPARSVEEAKIPTQQSGLFAAAEALRTAADAIEKAAQPEASRPARQRATPAATGAEGRITDVGENLWYNRRNQRGATTWDDVKNLNDALKVKEVVKAKVWPKPNYEQLVAEGMQPFIARMLKQVYDGIAAAPAGKSDAELQRYIDVVGRVREAVFDWAKDVNANREFLEKLAGAARQRMGAERGSFTPILDLMKKEEGFRDVILDRVWPLETEAQRRTSSYRFARGTEALADIRAIGGNRALKHLQFTLDDAVDAMKDLDKGWPASQEAWQRQGYQVVKADDIQVDYHAGTRTDGTKYVYVALGLPGRRTSIVTNTFYGAESKDDANVQDYVRAQLEAMEGKHLLLDKRGALASKRSFYETETQAKEAARELVKREGRAGGDLRGMNIAEAERTGPARRKEGENISAERLMQEFGFRGVNFGREGWINQAERQAYLNHAFDGLHDLAELLDVPPKALSLNGMLGIAFGAQGRGGSAAAHFVPGVNEINLTKTMGAGTLAHEWGHALDHYFATHAGLAKSSEPFMSEHATLGETRAKTDGYGRKIGTEARFGELRAEIVQAFKAVVETMEKRPMTEAEVKAQRDMSRKRSFDQLERWIQHFRKDIERVDASKLPEFDKLADRLRQGDRGKGLVKVGGQVLSEPVARIKELVKGLKGASTNIASNWKGLESNASHAAYILEQKEATDTHAPQTTATTYAGESSRKDQEKKGKPYWRTRTEMFARAFETWVGSRLGDFARTNTFLSDALRRAEAIDPTTGQHAQPYPRGEDRERINAAMEKLVRAIESKDTDKGVAMFSRGPTPRAFLSESFWKWFGKSKVVDDKGMPLVVYHGTTAEITAFNTAMTGRRSSNTYGKGGALFFTSNRNAASAYAMPPTPGGGFIEMHPLDQPNVLPVYLTLKNPLVIDAEGDSWTSRTFDAVVKAKRDGHDGVIIKNVMDHASAVTANNEGAIDVYVAFKPEQVKSALGNRGTFDPSNPDIRFSRQAENIEDYKLTKRQGQAHPLFFNSHIGLGKPSMEFASRDGERRMSYVIYDTKESIAQKTPVKLGVLRVDVDAQDRFTALHLIEIKRGLRQAGKGWGETVIASLLAHNGGHPMRIMNIQHHTGDDWDALPFWKKMGTELDNYSTDPNVEINGTLSLGRYLRARGGGGRFRRDGQALDESALQGRPDQAGRRAGAPARGGQVRPTDRGDGASPARDQSDARREGRGRARGQRDPRGHAGVGLAPSAIRQAISPILARWQNAPEVRVIASMDEAPEAVRLQEEAARSVGAQGAPEGFYYRGTVYLVAEGLGSPAAAYRTLFHETLGHAGLRGLLGNRLDSVLDDVARSMAGRVRAKAKQYGFDMENVTERRQAAEEVLAELAQTMPRSSFVQRVVAAIRQFLRDLGIQLELSEADIIEQFILPARRFIERGRMAEAEGAVPAPAFGRNAPWYYSALERQVRDLKQGAAPAAQWKGTLKAMKGVSKDELEWSGVMEWLDTRDGKVTKDELLDFLGANGVRVEETVLGDDGSATNEFDTLKVELDALGFTVETSPDPATDEYVMSGIARRSDDRSFNFVPGVGFENVDGTPADLPERVQEIGRRLAELEQEMPGSDINGEPTSTRYQRYTLPGGKNYREILLTLPEKTTASPDRAAYEAWASRLGLKPNATMTEERYRRETGRDAPAPRTITEMDRDRAQNFRSSHFDQPNILAHVRFDERTDAEGKRVLFIEEIQSDWAQKGKREGFAGTAAAATPEEEKAIREWAAKNVGKANAENFSVDTLMRDIGTLHIKEAFETAGLHSGTAAAERAAAIYPKSVPAAPFVGKTEAWVGLALKRMIAWAAEHGFDRVAWTTGKQQTDRYSLRHQVRSIEWVSDRSAGVKDIVITPFKGNAIEFAIGNDGVVTGIGSTRSGTQFDGKHLSDVIGKAAADKVLGSDHGELSGSGLEIGGEGMLAFYDSVLPKIANRLLEKLGGGRVGSFYLGRDGANKLLSNDSPAHAAAIGAEPVPGFDITPTLRDKALGGLALFSRMADQAKRAVTDSEAFRRWFGKSKVVDEQGKPLVVYRGEHGEPDGRKFQSRHGSISFGDRATASIYAMDPNVWGEKPAASRVIPAYLKIENPVIDSGDDPFISFDRIAQVLGKERAIQIARELSSYAKHTNNWEEHLSKEYDSPAEFLEKNPVEKWDGLYMDAYPIFDSAKYVGWFKEAGFDGAMFGGVGENAGEFEYRVFSEDQVRSAFEPEALFSRAPAIAGSPTTGDHRDSLSAGAVEYVRNLLHSDKRFSWWHRTIGTQQHKAMVNRDFARVYDESQAFLGDVSKYANEAADLAQDLLPRIEGFKDFAKKSPSRADVEAASQALYAGTLWGGGSPLEGRVWTDEELRAGRALSNMGGGQLVAFKPLNDDQIRLYRQALGSVGKSLDEIAKSIIHRLARPHGIGFDREMSLEDVAAVVREAIEDQIIDASAELQTVEDPDYIKDAAADAYEVAGGDRAGERAAAAERARLERLAEKLDRQIKELETLKNQVDDIEGKTSTLKARGYLPAMRFGQFALHVVRDVPGQTTPEQLFFGLYESQTAANLAYKELQKEFPGARIERGIVSKEQHRLFQGLSLDALETFADYITDDQGRPIAKDPLVQGFLKSAVAERSSLKRHIHRKGIAGYSDDLPRVLASFTVSSARTVSSNYHGAEMLRLANDIKAGDVKDEAIKLVTYLRDPQEEAQAIRGFLFAQFLGGSVAHGLVNMTQPFMVTVPYLSQHTSATDAAAKVAAAAGTRPEKLTGAIREAYERAKKEGVVAPQEIHQLRAETGGLPLAKNLALRKLSFLWGSIYAVTEQFNRSTAFIAAYRIAEQRRLGDPYAFAVNAVNETQFVYNKGNRPNWARGPVGATVFTFKQFSISYLELAKRLYAKDKKAFALMALTLLAAAGIEGLPFAEDVEDLIDTIGQWMGHATNSKKQLRKWATAVLGPDLAQVALHGISGLPWMPVDVSVRMGLQNLIPGTSMLKLSEKSKAREVLEVVGPVGQFVPTEDTMVGRALERIAQSDYFGAVKAGAPVAVQNVAKGAEMLATGEARDTRGRKVAPVTPGESVFKMAGLQPASVARESRRMEEVSQDINLQRRMEDEIAEQWARGIIDNDRAAVRDALKKMHDWNRENETLKVFVRAEQVRRRVKAMRMNREQRMVKGAPPEIRRVVKDALRGP